jgi:ARC6-like, IMS domain
VLDRSGIIQKLEDKVAAALRDHNLTAAAGGTPAAQSAMAEYNRLVQDASSSIGIRYLALHSVAVKQGFYVDKRDQQEMLGTVAQEMGNLSPGEVLAGIQKLKSNYPAIYQCDAVALDRMESNAVEFMTRLPMDQQDRAVAEAKNTQLKARPIDPAPVEIPVVAPQPFILSPQPMEPVPIPVTQAYAPQSTQTYTPQPAQTYIPQQTQLPAQNNNKGAVIIGGGMIAGAIIFSAMLISSQNSKTSIPTTNSPAQSTTAAISQDEAKKIIEKWMQAKQRMFAPPYDQQLGSQLTTGKAYRDKVRGPSSDGTPYSSLEWLRQYGFQYKYGVQNIENITRFESGRDQASIEVQILEDARLYNKDGVIQPKRSGMERKTVRFILKKDNGVFKISDYDVIGESKRKS